MECFTNFDYSSVCLSLTADLGRSCLTLCSLSIFIPLAVRPVTLCAPHPFHLYFYLRGHVCRYTRVHHIIPRLVLFSLDGFLPLLLSIFIYTYLATSHILRLSKLSSFALWCTKLLPIPPFHLLFSLQFCLVVAVCLTPGYVSVYLAINGGLA